ncbi:MAG: hypothetical protein C0412_11930 [Flavobacterium sp.]|nr:hypothetical protein [Flavobacterium sp.]
MNKSKTMQKKIIYTLIILLLFAACKYEDGPVVSLRSKEKRLLGDWSVMSLTIDGVDSTQYYNDSCGCKLRFYKDSYDETLVDFTFCRTRNNERGWIFGSFSFDEHENYLIVKTRNFSAYDFYYSIGPIAPDLTTHWEILKLTKKHFWFSCSLNNKIYVFKFS